MLKRFYLFVLATFCVLAVNGQGSGVIKGKIFDATSKEAIPFANVVLEIDGVQKTGVSSDFDGVFKFVSLSPGSYDIRIKYIGYNDYLNQGVIVEANKTTFIDAALRKSITELKTVDVISYKVPLISKDQTQSGGTVTREEIENLPTRNVASIAATSAGVYQADEGGALNMRGGRSSQTTYFVDGMRVIGSVSLPNAAIEQTTAITGGLSAIYGDVSGGAVSITTRGPSSRFGGGVEVLSSQFTDAFGFNLASLNLTGPLLYKNKGTKEKKAILGYFLAGEFEVQETPGPPATGVWQLKPDVLESLQNDPLRPTGFIQGILELTPNSHFVTSDDLVKQDGKPNADVYRGSFQGKLDFQPVDNIRFSVGSNYIRQWGKGYRRSYSLFNSANNNEYDNTTFRVFGRFLQKFGNAAPVEGEAPKRGGIKNAYYTLQVDYTKRTTSNEDPDLGLNPFNYGYVGKYDEMFRLGNQNFGALADTLFDSNGAAILDQFGQIVVGDPANGVFIPTQQSFGIPVGVGFTPSDLDPVLTSYHTDWLSHKGNTVAQLSDILGARGIVNGSGLAAVQNIWSAAGSQVNGYGYSDRDFFRLTAQGAADIGGHSFTFGLEYDQRIERAYGVSPFNQSGLWLHAAGLANRHIQERDLDNPILSYDAFGSVDSILYSRNYNEENQSTFDRNLRASLNLPLEGLDVIPVMGLNPADLNLGFFSPDELIQDGRSYVSFYGYDHEGNKLETNPGSLDFFTDESRPIPAFQPNYSAVYLEDKFDFDDLVFRLGVRVDRFDANQPVLKDPYLFVPAFTAGETSDEFNHPGSIGDDYVVYVDDASNPGGVLGYRNGDDWFGPDGKQIRNASNIAAQSAGGEVQPYLKEHTLASGTDLSLEAIEDYTPQINVMPRISFSFPVSDEALFFAHYDILTERPTTASRFNPIQYAYISRTFTGALINNPNLKPQRTVDYELGFQQKISRTSAIKISTFYREFKDMIQVIRVNDAYPVPNYRTYGNIDFATVKGLTISYDLRRTGNVRLTTSYTLQYADGTGSNENSAAGLISSSVNTEALRTIRPLDYDSRHRIVTSMDFRYGDGKAYNGPKIGGKSILKNSGFNLLVSASSGTPYSRKRSVSADGDVAGGIAGVSDLSGEINGASLPWNVRANLRVDKDFKFKIGTDKNERPKMSTLKIYLQINNLLDTRNVLGVYTFTGSPEDDGFLKSAQGAQVINNAAALGSAQSFEDLYLASMENPGLFSRPRTIRVGIRFGF